MPEIEPFRGILYDTSKVAGDKVLAPPYDVIDDAERKALTDRDKANCVRLILPEGEGDSKYAAAAKTMNQWLDGGVLVRDSRPAIYRYHQSFKIAELGERTLTRKGFIAAVRLHAFDEGVILPHERTLSGPKVDRLKLMQATSSHFSQIFTLYSDPSRRTDELFRKEENKAPILDAVTDDGTRHRLWRVDNREVIGALQKLMSPMKLYIADGHHRYETMLALRDWFRDQAGGDLSYKSAAQYGTLFCANMDDEGLVVLPTHRLIHGLESFDLADMLKKAEAYFEVSRIEGGAGDVERVKREIHELGGKVPAFAVIAPGQSDAWVLGRKMIDLDAAGLKGSRAVVDLDVTLLHELVIDRILGIDKAKQEAKTNIKYIKDTPQAFERTKAGEGQVCFILNPARLPQIRAIAQAGEFMPQKSTFFYPKIASGVVFNRIDPNEEIY